MLSKYLAITGVGAAQCFTEELNAENLAATEALIQTEATMISAGTELSRVYAIKKGFSYPVRPGYSAVGRIIGQGGGLSFQPGQRVFFTGPHASLCRFSQGDKTQGPFIFPLPDGIDPREATISTLALVAMNGVNAAGVKLGDTLAVFGLGTIGLISALLFQELGASVIALDPVESRCELARELGVRQALSIEGSKQAETIKKLTDGGADIALDATGLSEAIETAVNALRTHGQLIMLGTPRQDYGTNITPMLNAIHMKMLRITGAFNNLSPLFEREGSRLSVERNFRVITQRLADKRIDAQKIISHIIKPEQAQAAYHGLMYDKENYRAVVIDWS